MNRTCQLKKTTIRAFSHIYNGLVELPSSTTAFSTLKPIHNLPTRHHPHRPACSITPPPPPTPPPHIRRYSSTIANLPRDEEIRGPMIHLVNSEGTLDPPTSLRSVLLSIDRRESYVLQVAEPQPDMLAVCKIKNKQEVYRRERARRQAQKTRRKTNPALMAKELELNWAIDANDLGHRLNKLQEMLGKGMRIDIILAGKKKGRRATSDEAELVIRRIRERVEMIEGAKEWKPMEGKLLEQVTLFVEGKAGSLRLID
ncbi:MAG: hypothetical protein M1816_004857 [Peltula sp. TS41687]|nr:MAG: hypothetical protein M1816_004857 [Peltula sp. TS41687]